MKITDNKSTDDRIEIARKKIVSSLKHFFSRKIKHHLYHQPFTEPVILASIAVLLGVASATGVWLFKQMFSLPFRTVFGGINIPVDLLHQNWIVILLPVLGGVSVGLIAQFIIGKERYPGIAGVMEAAALNGGRLEYRKMPVKTVASALSIGSGASVGHGDPSVQIGATLGSMFGQLIRFSDERVRSLVAAGVAAGIAASFNAPIAGLAVGIAGFFLPQIFGTGYVTIEDILNGKSFSVSLLLFLVFAKLVLTPVCIGSGFYGGVFTPCSKRYRVCGLSQG